MAFLRTHDQNSNKTTDSAKYYDVSCGTQPWKIHLIFIVLLLRGAVENRSKNHFSFFYLFFLFIFSEKNSRNENSSQFNRTFNLGSPLSNETKIAQIGWKIMKLSWSKALKNKREKNASKEFWLGVWLQKSVKCLVHFTNFWYDFRHFVFRFLKKNNRRFKLDKRNEKWFLTDFQLHAPLKLEWSNHRNIFIHELLLFMYKYVYKYTVFRPTAAKRSVTCTAQGTAAQVPTS